MRAICWIVACSTHWLVHLSATNDLNTISLVTTIIEHGSLGEARFKTASYTNSSHLLDFLCHRNEINEISKLFAFKVTIEACHDNCLTLVGDLVNDLWQLGPKKLSLVDANNFSLKILWPREKRLIKLLNDELGLSLDLVMSDDAHITTRVPLIARVLNQEHFLLSNLLAFESPQQLCAFA